jgi:small subunit ribosomal protein S19
MVRSVWKGPFVDPCLSRSTFIKKMTFTYPVKVWSRRSVILPIFVGYTFNIYNGKRFFPIKVFDDMVGHKFGEFALTRRFVKHPVKVRKQKV